MIKGKVVYLAGPITGIPDYRAHFQKAEDRALILFQARVVLNPAALPGGLEHAAYMRIRIPMISEADCVLLLPGWRKSTGSQMEFSFARENGKQIYEFDYFSHSPRLRPLTLGSEA